MNYKIYSFAVMRSASLDFQDKVPYLTAILEDENGNRKSEFVHGYVDGMTININDRVVSEKGADGVEIYRIAK